MARQDTFRIGVDTSLHLDRVCHGSAMGCIAGRDVTMASFGETFGKHFITIPRHQISGHQSLHEVAFLVSSDGLERRRARSGYCQAPRCKLT
jgi:hypothetical protein